MDILYFTYTLMMVKEEKNFDFDIYEEVTFGWFSFFSFLGLIRLTNKEKKGNAYELNSERAMKQETMSMYNFFKLESTLLFHFSNYFRNSNK